MLVVEKYGGVKLNYMTKYYIHLGLIHPYPQITYPEDETCDVGCIQLSAGCAARF